MKYTALILFILLTIGCGTRKAVVDLQTVKTKDEAKTEATGSVSKQSEANKQSGTDEQLAKTDEKQESRTRELFDENGKLKERITELINSKSVDNSKRNTYNREIITTRSDSAFKVTTYRLVTITSKDKKKTTTTDRNGLYWLIGAVCVIGLAFWLKPWVK